MTTLTALEPTAISTLLAPPAGAFELPVVDVTPPLIALQRPDGSDGELAGELWPELAYAQANRRAGGHGGGPITVALGEVTRAQANELLVAWEHPLGPYTRLFGEQHFVMTVAGKPVAVACTGSVRSKTVAGGIPRRNVVELARIARHPDHPRSLRAMLRLWTDYLAPLWAVKYPDWQVDAAISYALPRSHDGRKQGNLYRFDAWKDLGFTRPWGGSTGWGNASKANLIGDGRKRIFLYRYIDETPGE